jgi:hypothetical protein
MPATTVGTYAPLALLRIAVIDLGNGVGTLPGRPGLRLVFTNPNRALARHPRNPGIRWRFASGVVLV